MKKMRKSDAESSQGSEDASNDSKIYSPILSQLLKKLRPFQREAFDFATRGIACDRQWAENEIHKQESTKKNKKQVKKTSIEKSKGCFEYDQEYLGKGRILLADEMGLGKTLTSLAIMTNYMDEWPLLILCPASLRYSWPAEIEKWLPSISPNSVYVVSGFDDADFFSNENKRKRIKIVVATYSLLQNRAASARVLQQFKFKCIIADESHNLKERNSQRCKLGLPLLETADRLVLLSGTPAMARPVELWPQIYSIAPKLFGSYTDYTKEHCNARRGRFGWDVSGLSNAEELHYNLRQIMVRRLKSNVLKELPSKQRSIVPVKIDPDKVKESRELLEELNETRLSVSDLVGSEAKSANFEARRLLMMAYQSSGLGKARAVTEFLLDWLAGSGMQKILVFAHHKEVMDTLESAVAKKFKGVGHIRIDGAVSPAERAVRVRKFQTNSRVRVALLSMTAAGVGLTLTAASSVIFAELHWTPGVLAQAEDRCHRIGQQNAVSIMYCVCKDEDLSVDLKLWKMLSRKVGNLGKIIDGCKGASMNAKESDSAKDARESAGISGEDELTRFFADTSPTERNLALSREPVKGSIMSFFKKSNTESAPTELPLTVNKTHPNQRAETAQIETQNKPKTVSWSCESCTFDNSSQSLKDGWLSCKMCGNPHFDGEEHNSRHSDVCTLTPLVVAEKGENDSVKKSTGNNNGGKGMRLIKQAVTPCSSTKRGKRNASKDFDIIVLDDDDEDDGKEFKKDVNSKVNIIDRNPVAPRGVVTPSELGKYGRGQISSSIVSYVEVKSKVERTSNMLSFCVSKNSGRIFLHAPKGEPFHVSFEVEQVVTEETADYLLDAKTKRVSQEAKRSRPNVEATGIRFNDSAINDVIRNLGHTSEAETIAINPLRADKQSCKEMKEFVSSYLLLREVEKKVLKEWDEPVSSSNLRQTVAKILTSSVTNSCTDRYSGGAKELAVRNSENGTASHIDKAVLNGFNCAWCANRLPKASFGVGVDATYCSHTCAEEGRLRRGGAFASTRVRAQVFGLEGGVCQKCGIDANALFLRIFSLAPAERLNALCNVNWQLPRSGPALERLLQNPKEGDFWQADHIIAVAEGGGSCGLDNVRTLCSPCHKVETEKLRARLRLNGGVHQQEGMHGKRKQMDIRSSFFTQCQK